MFAATALARYADGAFTITGWGIVFAIGLARITGGT